jgi:hemerythrin-like domain-containing protein
MSQKPGARAIFSAGPAPDFDHPLEMLAACHDRIEDRCEVLHRLLDHLPKAGCDADARQAASSVMRYFDTAGEHHHEDEEFDRFPLVAAKSGEAATLLLIEHLRADHARMRALWRELREALRRIADADSSELDPQLVARFTTLYRAHIALEDAEMLPLAARVLEEADHAALGAVMARRRGVKP